MLTLQVFPPISSIRNVSHAIAVAVAKAAQEDGLATVLPEDGDWFVRSVVFIFIRKHPWHWPLLTFVYVCYCTILF